MQCLGTSTYTIFLILLKFKNLRNLINVLIKKNYVNIYLSVSYDFSKFNESKKIKV
jgi:hypothetical protein